MVTLSIADVLVALSCFGSISLVIYQAGRLAARVDSLEEWRRSIPRELGAIHEAIRKIAESIGGR